MLGVSLALLVAVLLLMVLVTRRPGFYLSASKREAAKLLDAARTFSDKAAHFYSQKSSGRDFEIQVTEDELNGYLAAANDDDIWKHLALQMDEMRRTFTTESLRNVQVALREGKVTVAGETSVAGMNLVVSLVGVPRIDGEGRVAFHVESIYAGALRLPLFFFGALRDRLERHAFPSNPKKLRVTSLEVSNGKARLTLEAVRRNH